MPCGLCGHPALRDQGRQVLSRVWGNAGESRVMTQNQVLMLVQVCQL